MQQCGNSVILFMMTLDVNHVGNDENWPASVVMTKHRARYRASAVKI